ncbi:MAG TPA: zinc-regulated TonB-dependent outer membrane receptor [Kofleriaceae bacterium]|nr:zinc-regulated TonB-dependent outer membrane receptor [Kofleriaceae bacterium]
MTIAAPADAQTDEELEAALAADAAAQTPPSAPTPAGDGSAAKAMLLPDISVILDVAAAWFSDQDHLQSGGHDPTRTGFTLQQVELALGKAVDPYFRFDANLVFTPEGVEVEEAYATTLALPANLQVRAGEMFTRFGRANAQHPHQWDFADQPFALGRVFGADGYHGPGVEVSYLTPLPWFVEVVASATDAHGEETARSFLGDADVAIETPIDVLATGAVKQFFELGPDWSLLTGVSIASGPNATATDVGAKRTNVVGADLYLKWRPISYASDQMVALQSEWLYRRRQVPGQILADVNGYAYVVAQLAKRWAVGARWELGTPADESGADDLDPMWTENRQRITTNVTFHPTEFSRLRLQGSVDRPGWRDDIWAAFVALEVSAGAHGAHRY